MPYEDLDTSSTGLDQLRSSEVGCSAEWHHAKHVLLHTPGEEIFLGVVHPEAALFERTFSVDGARQEHDNFVKCLRDANVPRVETVAGVLLKGTEAPGSDRDRLIKLALAQTKLDVSRLRPEDQEKQRKYFRETTAVADARVLLRMIMQRPAITLAYKPADADPACFERRFAASAADYDVVASYALDPLMNMYFTRDHMITTAKGVVTGKMRNPQRAGERDIIAVVLEKLGIKPLLDISQGEGHLEGGDFIPAGEHAFIGIGMRTDQAAVNRMLAADVFGSDTVVVVKDKWHNQQEMHLDTFFNVIARDLVVLVEDRLPGGEPRKQLQADIYVKRSGKYVLESRDVSFHAWLLKNKYGVLPVSVKDQQAYGINFLTITSRKIIGVEGVSDQYKQALREQKVDATWLDFANLKYGYGAAHCTTQVLLRSP